MWYIAASCWAVALLAHLYPCSRYPGPAYKVNRGIVFLSLAAIAAECNLWILCGYVLLCADLLLFVPIFLRAQRKQQKTWALLLVVVLEVGVSLYLFVVLCIWPTHVGPAAGLLLGNSLLQVLWYRESDVGEDYSALG